MVLNGKKILVTGGAGFIGSHLVDRLVELGAEVTVVDNLSFGKKENLNPAAKFERTDIRDFQDLVRSVQGKDIIYHLAASATTKESSMGWDDPLFDLQVNLVGTLNILMAIREAANDSLLVFTSSAAVYGNPQYTPMDEKHPTSPISPYGVTKLAGEKYVAAFVSEWHLKSVILRLFNIYGPRQPRYVMYDFLEKLHRNPHKLEVLGDGSQGRDFCYVSDAVDTLLLAGEGKLTNGEILNVGGGTLTNVGEIALKAIRSLRLEGKTEINYTGESWKGDIHIMRADVSKIKEALGWKPMVSLDDGISHLKQWYEQAVK